MAIEQQKLIVRCLRTMLRPVVRFCLRHSLRIQEFLETAKVAFIEVASDDMDEEGEKVNVSRLSVMTGIHRRDVMRIYRDEDFSEEPYNLITRLIGHWRNSPKFSTAGKKPRVLTVDGENSEFRHLVSEVSNDLNAGTILFELERIGAVEHVARGIRLLTGAYVPRGNAEKGFQLLGKDTEDLITAVEQNIFTPQATPNLHARTEYDNVRPDAVPHIRDWLLTEGSAFHTKANKYVAQFDRDIHPNKKGDAEEPGVRVVLGAFSLVAEPKTIFRKSREKRRGTDKNNK